MCLAEMKNEKFVAFGEISDDEDDLGMDYDGGDQRVIGGIGMDPSDDLGGAGGDGAIELGA